MLASVLTVLLAGEAGPTSDVRITLNEIAAGFAEPVLVTHAGDGSGRLFVVERSGVVRVLAGPIGPAGRHPAYLDLRGVVSSAASEQGLLGLAFHPRFAANGQLYACYTDADDATVIAGFRARPDAQRVDPSASRTLLRLEQPASNHNGGHLAFGPDGYLYVGTGDGGGAGDTYGNGQDPSSLLGKMLRIDVDRGEPYAVPRDNPFAYQFGFRPEIWAFGLRNPWRYSFDRGTGDLYIGDVGQSEHEEIDWLPAGTGAGANLGWPVFEGRECYADPGRCLDAAPTVDPVVTYTHDDGCSVTGGYVYRGRRVPLLHGAYVYGDYCSGRIWAARRDASGAWRADELLDSDLAISSFGEDEAGELYVADKSGGRVYRLGRASAPAADRLLAPTGSDGSSTMQPPGFERR